MATLEIRAIGVPFHLSDPLRLVFRGDTDRVIRRGTLLTSPGAQVLMLAEDVHINGGVVVGHAYCVAIGTHEPSAGATYTLMEASTGPAWLRGRYRKAVDVIVRTSPAALAARVGVSERVARLTLQRALWQLENPFSGNDVELAAAERWLNLPSYYYPAGS